MKKYLINIFPHSSKLAKSAWFLLICTTLQVIVWFWQAVVQGMVGWYITAILKVALGFYAIWAIVNILRYRVEGFMQLLLVYGVGLFAGASTSGWAFDFSGWIAIRLFLTQPQYQYGATEPVGYSVFSVNILVFFFWFWIGRNILKLKAESQIDDLRKQDE